MAGQVYLLDSKGCIVFGVKSSIGKPFWELFNDGYRESIKSAVSICLVAGEGAQMHALDVNGERQHLELFAIPSEAGGVLVVCEAVDRRIDALSERQRQICRLIGHGFTGSEIRKRTKLARSTIDGHKKRVRKLLTMGEADFMVWCVENRSRF